MPKNGFLTPKAIGNRIKSKGLQKLRWYCQVCQKQCRDANGFKCHVMSEPHQRQMLLVGQNTGKVIDEFSQEFRDGFLTLLRRSYNTRRVMANSVYNAYIGDKEHIHMNASKWQSLTEFVKYLGREGYCLVDETPKGWYIQWIDRDPETLERQARLRRMEASRKDEADRQAEMLEAQMERDRQAVEASGVSIEETEKTALLRESEDDKVVVSLKRGPTLLDATTTATAEGPLPGAALDELAGAEEDAHALLGIKKKAKRTSPDARGKARPGKPLSALEQIRLDNERAKRAKLEREQERLAREQQARPDRVENWLYPGLVVKVINKKVLDGRYYKCKGVVLSLVDDFVAKVKLLDSKATLKLDQDFLETVIPKPGGVVLVVNGPLRGAEAVVEEILEKDFSCRVQLTSGPTKGDTVRLPYEDICRLDA
ncbi:uncharacterized protein MONBRDRAFT_8991 [Monosiga brevicollis MX1]|uniref:DNA/RNA-binding protein Kin17 WH-like domain-containing protein n=1 Tax=Monosiga brevicollis TaxID=81824 RepID=A9V1R6_MONBE|nr:uncharacterized protein MONBRDRAFT_8991 [Monosiga brevicollis MX1]EDQ88608.1 predicted protein [Monosiga brevicollis MX1]|eukprot:XP_001746712.1 hypothetical protein [Monosiga brevicollis MX1]